jgi:hypothetical protein
MSATIEGERISQDEDVLVLSMQFEFDPSRARQTPRMSPHLHTSTSEHLVNFVRRLRGGASPQELQELRERVEALVLAANSIPRRSDDRRIDSLAHSIRQLIDASFTSNRVEVDLLVGEIRELRQYSQRLAAASSMPRGRRTEPTPGDAAQLLRGVERFLTAAAPDRITLKRCSFGSPFEITVAIATGGAGLRLLFYGARRILGFDLEIAAYRAELRERLAEAERAAADLARRPPADADRTALDAQLSSINPNLGQWRGSIGTAGAPEDFDAGAHEA